MTCGNQDKIFPFKYSCMNLYILCTICKNVFFKTLLVMFDFHVHQRLLSFVENGPKLKKTKKSFSKENLELCKLKYKKIALLFFFLMKRI